MLKDQTIHVSDGVYYAERTSVNGTIRTNEVVISGGGGSGSQPSNPENSNAGNGGEGTESSISGTATMYAGGGGGGGDGRESNAPYPGGYGKAGGGNGGDTTAAGGINKSGKQGIGSGFSAEPNTGSGGGGGGEPYNQASEINAGGGDGGSGIVIIRYKNTGGMLAFDGYNRLLIENAPVGTTSAVLHNETTGVSTEVAVSNNSVTISSPGTYSLSVGGTNIYFAKTNSVTVNSINVRTETHIVFSDEIITGDTINKWYSEIEIGFTNGETFKNGGTYTFSSPGVVFTQIENNHGGNKDVLDPTKLTDGVGPIEYTGGDGKNDVNILGFQAGSVGRHSRFAVTVTGHLDLSYAKIVGITNGGNYTPINPKASIVETIPSAANSTATFDPIGEVNATLISRKEMQDDIFDLDGNVDGNVEW